MWGWLKKSFRKKRRKAAPKPEVFDLVIGTYRKHWPAWLKTLVGAIVLITATGIAKSIWPDFPTGVFIAMVVIGPALSQYKVVYRFGTAKIYVQQGSDEHAFGFRQLTVEAPTKAGWNPYDYMEFWDRKTAFSYAYAGTGFHLSAETVWALAELQKRGADINVAGFGRFEIPEQHPSTERIYGALGVAYLVYIVCFLAASGLLIALLLNHVHLLTIIPIIVLFLMMLPFAKLNRKLSLLGASQSFPIWVEVTDSEVALHKFGKKIFAVKLEEIKTIFVTIEPGRFNITRISVEIQTHYARSYKLLNRAGALSFSHCLFLEHARDLGLHIVYRRIVKGSGEMVVIHEVDPEGHLLSLLESESEFDPTGELNEDLVDQNQVIGEIQ
jgi:hypothetical protein